MLAWCSMCVSSTTSPSRRLAPPHDEATRLIASVAFLVKTTSSARGALISRATAARALLVAVGRLGGEAVGAAVDRRVRRALERVHRLDHRVRLLRGVARVEIDDRRAVDLAAQDREVVPDALPVDASCAVTPTCSALPPGTTRSPRARAARRARCHRSRRSGRRRGCGRGRARPRRAVVGSG